MPKYRLYSSKKLRIIAEAVKEYSYHDSREMTVIDIAILFKEYRFKVDYSVLINSRN